MIMKTEELVLSFCKLCYLITKDVEKNCFDRCFISVLSVKCAECLHHIRKKYTFLSQLFVKIYFVKIVNWHSLTFSCCYQQLINFFESADLWALSIFSFSFVFISELFSSDSVLSLFILSLSSVLNSDWSK